MSIDSWSRMRSACSARKISENSSSSLVLRASRARLSIEWLSRSAVIAPLLAARGAGQIRTVFDLLIRPGPDLRYRTRPGVSRSVVEFEAPDRGG